MAASMDEDLGLLDSDDYYAWLGLSKSASKEEISNAFRRMSRLYHPDKHATNPALREKAQKLFTKINKAHEVLSDSHKRAIYDTMGVRGLKTDDWQLIPKNRTPQEILEEYEKLQQEREERRMQQCTNPRGNINIGVDATNIFEAYDEDMDYGGVLPQVEISSMSISQSVEAPLTSKDTVTLSGTLNTHNGVGSGHINAALRRIISPKGWAEFEVGAGNGGSFTLRGFRNLWHRAFATMSGSLQITSRGIRPHMQTVIVQQLDKNVSGRLVWNAGSMSSMTTILHWDNNTHHVIASLQFARLNIMMSLQYSYQLWEDGKAKLALRLGTVGAMLEYGCEKKITQFSTLGATLVLGIPLGVTLKIKVNRGNQTFGFPIHLAESIAPNAVFYGTFIPIATYFAIKKLVVEPFLRRQKENDAIRKKKANLERLAEKKREAETHVELMGEAVARSIEVETAKKGLVVQKALYGKLKADNISEVDCINVTKQLQTMVKDSAIKIPEGVNLSELQGFYDPCIGEEKELSVIYQFRGQLHQCQFKEGAKILLPNREHLVNDA